MLKSRARVETSRPDRYRKQLASHLGRRCSIDEADDGTWITLPLDGGMGRCFLTGELSSLLLVAEADSNDNLAQVHEVVGGHLERFGERDGLTVAWSPAE